MLSLFPQLFTYELVGLFLLRLTLGLIFLGHGYSKLFKTRLATAGFFEATGFKPGKFWTIFVGTAEAVSGLLLIAGLFTQAAVIVISLIMVVAAVKVDIKKGFLGGWELNLLVVAGALILLFSGPGIFALDLPL